MKTLYEYKWPTIGLLLGGIGGYVYWKEVGCLTGTCPMRSPWQTMIPYGMLLGFLTTQLFKPSPH